VRGNIFTTLTVLKAMKPASQFTISNISFSFFSLINCLIVVFLFKEENKY